MNTGKLSAVPWVISRAILDGSKLGWLVVEGIKLGVCISGVSGFEFFLVEKLLLSCLLKN